MVSSLKRNYMNTCLSINLLVNDPLKLCKREKVFLDECTYCACSEIPKKLQRLFDLCKVKLPLLLSDSADGMHVFALSNRLESR